MCNANFFAHDPTVYMQLCLINILVFIFIYKICNQCGFVGWTYNIYDMYCVYVKSVSVQNSTVHVHVHCVRFLYTRARKMMEKNAHTNKTTHPLLLRAYSNVWKLACILSSFAVVYVLVFFLAGHRIAKWERITQFNIKYYTFNRI